jgi:hypothetical protein
VCYLPQHHGLCTCSQHRDSSAERRPIWGSRKSCARPGFTARGPAQASNALDLIYVRASASLSDSMR